MALILRFIFAMLLGIAATLPRIAVSEPVQFSECWMCWTDPEEHEEYGTIHWDDQGGFVQVMPPDGRHSSWGVDSCTEGIEPAAHTFTTACPSNDNESLELLVHAYRSGDLYEMARSYTQLERATLNKNRQAIQLTACSDDGVIVAHLPLKSLQFATLAELVATAAVDELQIGQKELH